jgi:hypothetical protein
MLDNKPTGLYYGFHEQGIKQISVPHSPETQSNFLGVKIMSNAKNIKAAVSVLALSFAAGLAYADNGGRSDTLGQYTAFKNQDAAQVSAPVQVKNQTRDQVKTSVAGNGRSDTLGLYIAAKNETPVHANTALAATKSNQGSNQSGQ